MFATNSLDNQGRARNHEELVQEGYKFYINTPLGVFYFKDVNETSKISNKTASRLIAIKTNSLSMAF